jgi:hypothetical protein
MSRKRAASLFGSQQPFSGWFADPPTSGVRGMIAAIWEHAFHAVLDCMSLSPPG